MAIQFFFICLKISIGDKFFFICLKFINGDKGNRVVMRFGFVLRVLMLLFIYKFKTHGLRGSALIDF